MDAITQVYDDYSHSYQTLTPAQLNNKLLEALAA